MPLPRTMIDHSIAPAKGPVHQRRMRSFVLEGPGPRRGRRVMRVAHGSRFERDMLVDELRCPECHEDRVYRSTRRGILEWLLRIVRIYPFRCDICGYRFRRFTRRRYWR